MERGDPKPKNKMEMEELIQFLKTLVRYLFTGEVRIFFKKGKIKGWEETKKHYPSDKK